MEVIGTRLRSLRECAELSQAKMAAMVGITQASINRYEMGQVAPPLKTLLWYADYFDVSLDYLFGRTDQPQGKLYECRPEVRERQPKSEEDLKDFVEMCFDPQSPVSERMKRAMLRILREANP